MNENELRDLVAERLEELVESGLELVETEFRLPNFHGAKGFVDILARDQYGFRVLIELKRSDTAARQALHELHKYTSLMQTEHGLGPTEVRCIVLSTGWHELLVPFSSFVAHAPYSVVGYRLVLDSEGNPTRSETVPPLSAAAALVLCPSHGIYLFGEQSKRDAFVGTLAAAVQACGVEDFLLLATSYPEPPQRVIYPFAVYLAMAALDPVTRLHIETDSGVHLDPEEEAEADPWLYEETVQGEINRHVHPDDFEIGYPDKFSAHEDRWMVQEIRRFGRFASDAVRTDDDILALVRGETSPHTVRFRAVATPRYGAAWSDTRERLRPCLLGSGPWLNGVEIVLDELEAHDPNAHVEISAYNPCDMLMALYKAGSAGSPLYIPTLRIVITPSEDGRKRAVIGFISWDGSTCPASFEDVLHHEFEGDVFNYFLRRHFNELWEAEQAIAAAHGLSYFLEEVEVEGQDPVEETRHALYVVGGDQLVRDDPTGGPWIFDFCVANKAYLEEIAAAFSSVAHGL